MKEGFLYKRGVLPSPAAVATPLPVHHSHMIGKEAFAALQETS